MPKEVQLPENDAAAAPNAEGAAPQPPAERQPTKRERDMELVDAMRAETVAKELGVKPEDLLYTEPDPDVDPDDAEAEAERARLAADAADEQAAEVEHQTAAVEPTLIDDPSKYRVKIKVDGEERTVSAADLIRVAQKEEAADKRLREATLLLQQAGEASARAVAPAPPPEPEVPAVKPSKKFIDAMLSGDEEAAGAAFEEALAGRAARADTTQPNAGQIAAQVRQQINVDSALSAFNDAHPDILADADRINWANRYLMAETGGRELQTLAPQEMSAALSAAGRLTRLKFGLKEPVAANAPKPASTTTRQEKLARKQTIDEVTSANTSAAETAPKPETRESVIDTMRAGRRPSL